MNRIFWLWLAVLLLSCTDHSNSMQNPGAIQALKTHDGFVVSYYAREIGQGRFMAIAPDGELCVAVPEKHHILKLTDSDDDGVADLRNVIAEGLNEVHSLAFLDHALYAVGTTSLWRLADDDKDGYFEKREVLVDDIPAGGHWTRTLVIGPDRKLYVSVGSSCNICEEADSRRAAVVRYNLDGSGEEIYASGLRNAVGVMFRPETNDLWGVVNGRDRLHDDLPPEEALKIHEGGFHGWPYAYGQKVTDPRFDNYEAAAESLPPDIEMQAHTAPLGMTFYTGGQFPADYHGDLLVAMHGSWNRSSRVGAKIVRMKVDAEGQPAVQDFITGWQDENGDRWGRPVDLVVGPKGEIFISDDFNNCIYRVTYTHGTGAPYLEGFRFEKPLPRSFDGRITFSYTLPAESETELRIYDHAGQIIAVLKNGRQGAGSHSIAWSGANAAGIDVAPGEYVVQLRVHAKTHFFQRTYPIEKQ